MKDNRKYFFVGARYFCLEKMFELNLNIIEIAAVKDSPVDKILKQKKIKHHRISNKKQLLNLIRKTQFDVLVSNGCPYILPVSELKKDGQLFINVHPSLLPDLRGIHPINGSILFDRPQGATCHIMDDGIDTGNIIAQRKVKDKSFIPADLLYQLSFIAEAKVFEEAYHKNFLPKKKKKSKKGTIYYSRKESDQIITSKDDIKTIFKKVKAFQVDGQYAHFMKNGITYFVKDVILIDTMLFNRDHYKNNEIIHVYQNNVLTKEKCGYVLWRLSSDELLKPQTTLL